jgi:hypothetical protein
MGGLSGKIWQKMTGHVFVKISYQTPYIKSDKIAKITGKLEHVDNTLK